MLVIGVTLMVNTELTVESAATEDGSKRDNKTIPSLIPRPHAPQTDLVVWYRLTAHARNVTI